MSIFNQAIGAFDALMSQARTYKMGAAANTAKRIASDIATRAGGARSIKRFAAFGAVAGGAAGGAYNYYEGGDVSSIGRGALQGAVMGAGLGAGYRVGRGALSSIRGGVLGGYASSARAAMSSRVAAGRLANNMEKARTSFRMV